jgi:hypothetical protein
MDRSAAELAIRALEAERQKIDSAIRELRSLVVGGQPEAQPARKSRLSRAGRKRISEAAKRRWASADEAKSTASTPAASKKKSARKKTGGLTPEGRAKIAEATRQRNIARAAAAKKAAKKAS